MKRTNWLWFGPTLSVSLMSFLALNCEAEPTKAGLHMGSQYALMAFVMLKTPQIPSPDHTGYYVRSVTFIGSLDRMTDKNLRDASTSIEEGKVYSLKALDRAIARINKLGFFRKITRVDCRVTRSNINPGTIDIEIKLKLIDPVSGRSDKLR